MKIFKSRIFIGIICIVAALAISFGVAPLTNRIMDSRKEVVRVKNTVPFGQEIKASDIEVVMVGSYNLPSGVITDRSRVEGKFAATDLLPGDYVFNEKLTDLNLSAKNVFKNMGDMYAMSVTVQSYAAGLSGKLDNGDLVTFVALENGEAIVPEGLEVVQVITTTDSEGFDKDEVQGNVKPTTITVLVTLEQAKTLTKYEKNGYLHVVLLGKI